MYTDEGELEFDEDEMAALQGQRLVAELFLDSGSLSRSSKASIQVSRQEILVAVNKLFNCRLSLTQFNSNKLPLQKRP